MNAVDAGVAFLPGKVFAVHDMCCFQADRPEAARTALLRQIYGKSSQSVPETGSVLISSNAHTSLCRQRPRLRAAAPWFYSLPIQMSNKNNLHVPLQAVPDAEVSREEAAAAAERELERVFDKRDFARMQVRFLLHLPAG